jgi:polyisoprenoid-binding protein YceI
MTTTISPGTEALPIGTWNVDSAHSRVEFALEYMGGTFRGGFSPFEAQLEVGDDGAATLTGAVRVESVRVQDENLEAHLLSPEFFDAERAPELTFRSTEIRREDDELTVAGELAVRNRAVPVELRGALHGPLQDAYGRERVSLTLSTTVDRTAFGLDWNAPLPSGEPALADETTLTAELFMVRV